MLFLSRWAERRRQAARLIYHYHDGHQMRHADPLVLWRKLTLHPAKIAECLVDSLKAGRGPDPETITALREVFAAEPFDETTGRGLTEGEVSQLYWAFANWSASLKKNAEPGQTSPQPTASEPSITPEAPAAATQPS
jgi:hypothetical protein